MNLYLIAGKAGSGKNEVAKIIKEYYLGLKKKVLITEFSKYLKLYAKEIIDWDGTGPKPRRFLQDLGVTIRENMGMNKMLINRMLEDLKIYTLYYDVVIINDVRYPEEIEELKKVYPKAKSLYIINQFAKSELSLEEQLHITETALEDFANFDVTVTNDNINVLDNRIIKFLESSSEE